MAKNVNPKSGVIPEYKERPDLLNPKDYEIPVQRKDIGRFYSCPIGAALSLIYEAYTDSGEKPEVMGAYKPYEIARDIIYVCEGVLPKVRKFETCEFVWANEKLSYYTNLLAEAEYKRPKTIKIPSGGSILERYPLIRQYVIGNEEALAKPTPARDLVLELEKISGKTYSPLVLARHISQFREIYSRGLGIEVLRMHHRESGNDLLMFQRVSTGTLETIEEILWKPKKGGPKSIPVVNNLNGEVYLSMRHAVAATDIPPYMIMYNCVGDIPFILREGVKYYLAFANSSAR